MTATIMHPDLHEKEKFHQALSRTFRNNPLILLGTVILLILVIASIGAPWIAPHSPYEQHLDTRRLAPFTNPDYPLGTDELGRCLLSRVIYGGRVSLSVGILTSLLSAFIGIPIGLFAGYSTNALSELLARVIDIVLATPEILLALALATILGRSLLIVMVAVSLVWWANYSRIVRGQVLQARETDYVTAARTIGASDARIIWRHIFPNTISQVLVMLSLNMAAAILIEAGLSFLGLGTQPPTPSWGAMLSIGRNHLQTAPWLATVPGIAIMATVLGFNLLGDGFRDVFDPRMRK
jgi:peptide/nickel transport system permease protein